jgi:hypothetical protein
MFMATGDLDIALGRYRQPEMPPRGWASFAAPLGGAVAKLQPACCLFAGNVLLAKPW